MIGSSAGVPPARSLIDGLGLITPLLGMLALWRGRAGWAISAAIAGAMAAGAAAGSAKRPESAFEWSPGGRAERGDRTSGSGAESAERIARIEGWCPSDPQPTLF